MSKDESSEFIRSRKQDEYTDRMKALWDSTRNLKDPTVVPALVAYLREARKLFYWFAGADRLPAKETAYAVEAVEKIDALLKRCDG